MKKSVFISLSIITTITLLIAFILPTAETHIINPINPINTHKLNNLWDKNRDPQVIPSVDSKINNQLPDKLIGTSLKGTEIDGLYPVDQDGNLLFSKSIKNRFEYFLSLMGEFELDQVLQMIKDDIALNLTSPAKEQALKLFDDYVAYKYALAELEASLSAAEGYETNDIQRIRYQLQQMRDVRREYLPIDAVDAFFGFDEMYDDFMISSLEIKNNQQLTESEKRQQLIGLENNLPQDVQTMRDETQRVSQVFLITEDIKKSGGTDQDVFAVNEREFGQEAALRLQVLNEQRNQWQSRVDNYVETKQSIESNDQLTQEQIEDQLRILKETQFEPTELNKLSVYEIMKKESSRQ
ncbi:MAG: lipase chaperone LimK [Psychrobacter glaciei]|jgi:lipase chaperone LimK